MTGQKETNTSSARVVVTRVFGVLVAASAAEHGLGEALQGNRAPAGPVIQSWPDAAFFRIEAGEPALTLVPNLLAAGVLTLLLSTVFVWRVMARSARIPRVDLALVSILLLLVGGGFGPPTRIEAQGERQVIEAEKANSRRRSCTVLGGGKER